MRNTTSKLNIAMWRDILLWMKPYSLHALGYVIFMGMGAALGLVTPFVTGAVIDALVEHQFSRIPLLVAFTVVASTVVAVTQFARNQCSGALTRGMGRDLSLRLFHKVQRGHLDFFRVTTTGEITNVLRYDVDQVSDILYSTIFPAIFSVAVVVSTVAAMMLTNLVLSAACLIIIPMWLLVSALTTRAISPLQRSIRMLLDDHNAVVTERLSFAGIVRAKSNIQYERDLAVYRHCLDPMTKLSRSLVTAFGVSGIAATFVSAAGPAAILLLGALLVRNGQATVGMLTAFMALLARLYGPVSSLVQLNSQLPRLRVAHERIVRMLNMDSEDDHGDVIIAAKQLEFRDAIITRDAHEILCGVSLKIEPGEHVAIVGASGSGKTTITHTMLRFINLTGGAFNLAGKPATSYQINALRDCITYVPDEASLFKGTLYENLTYGADNADVISATEVLRLVELDRSLESRTEGLETRLGLGGAPLSAGERQRVMIARALLRDRSIYIFDEATSAIDLSTERRILTKMMERLKGRTLILISHRLGSLDCFQRVIMIERGRVIEDGTYDDVIGARGRLAAVGV